MVPRYNGSESDSITSEVVNQPTSIGVTTTLANKCGGGGIILGAIIGVAIGAPILVIIALTIIHIVVRNRFDRATEKF